MVQAYCPGRNAEQLLKGMKCVVVKIVAIRPPALAARLDSADCARGFGMDGTQRRSLTGIGGDIF